MHLDWKKLYISYTCSISILHGVLQITTVKLVEFSAGMGKAWPQAACGVFEKFVRPFDYLLNCKLTCLNCIAFAHFPLF